MPINRGNMEKQVSTPPAASVRGRATAAAAPAARSVGASAGGRATAADARAASGNNPNTGSIGKHVSGFAKGGKVTSKKGWGCARGGPKA